MKKYLLVPFISALLFCKPYARAQDTAGLHSLQQKLLGTPNDTARISLLHQIGFMFADVQVDSSIIYGEKGLALAEKLKDAEKIAFMKMNLGWFLLSKPDYLKAQQLSKEALSYYEVKREKKNEAIIHYHLGWIYEKQGLRSESLAAFIQSRRLAEEIHDDEYLARSLYSIGCIYQDEGNFPEAENYEQQALTIDLKSDRRIRMAVEYTTLGEIAAAQNKWDEAEKYYLETIPLLGIQSKLRLGMIYVDLAGVYAHTNRSYKKLQYYLLALKQFRDCGSEKGIAEECNHIAGMLAESHQADKALAYIDTGLGAATRAQSLAPLFNLYYTLYSIQKNQGNYEEALAAYEQAQFYSDSITRGNNRKDLAEMQTRFETDQKDKEISLLNAEKQLQQTDANAQRLLKNIFIGGSVALLLLALLLINMYQIKKRSEKTLQEKNKIIRHEKERAEESEQREEEFIAQVSHEIRTPTSVVLGITRLLADTSLSRRQKQYITAIQQSSENLLNIVNEVLDLSRIKSGKLEVEKSPFLIHEWLQFTISPFQYTAKEKGIELSYHIEDSVPGAIISDPQRLKQVLVNLIGNAMKFTDEGSVILKVKNENAPTIADSRLMFYVIDTGAGISSEKLPHIFERFEQGDSSEGTGLGLAIAKLFVELLGGKITVASESGKGTTFSFTLPYQSASEQQISQTLSGKSKNILPIANYQLPFNLRILLAEDHPYNQLLIVDTIKKYLPHAKVDIAENGNEVLDQLKFIAENPGETNRFYDCLFIDIQMPLMDGFETAHRIRTEFPSPISDIPIINLTASVRQDVLERIRNSDMNGFVPKPFTDEQLLGELMRVLKINIPGISLQERKNNSLSNNSTGKGETGTLDWTYFKKFSEGDPQQFRHLLQAFLSAVQYEMNQMQRAIEQSDRKLLSASSHKLKTQLASVGLVEAVEMLNEIEKDNGATPQHLQYWSRQVIAQTSMAVEEALATLEIL